MSNITLVPYGTNEDQTKRQSFIKKLKDTICENTPQDLFLIKEISPNILTNEASEFVSSLKSLFQEYFSLIDSQILKIDYTKFYFGKTPHVIIPSSEHCQEQFQNANGSSSPHPIHILTSCRTSNQQDDLNFNGYLKKNLYLELLVALKSNKSVCLESHVSI